MRCASIWCLVFGILGLPLPSSICGLVVGSQVVCCGGTSIRELKQQVPCARAGAITGLVFTLLEAVGFLAIAVYLLSTVFAICASLYFFAIDDECYGRRRALTARDPLDAAPSSLDMVSLLPLAIPMAKLRLPAHDFLAFEAALKKGLTKHAKTPTSQGGERARLLQTQAIANDDSCVWPPDGICDDGGIGHAFDVCDCGTDVSDCGVRADVSACTANDDSCAWSDNGSCDDGGAGSPNRWCVCGTDLSDCGVRTEETCKSDPASGDDDDDELYSSDWDSCFFASDGTCDDGGPNSAWSSCGCGEDPEDCGERTEAECAAANAEAAAELCEYQSMLVDTICGFYRTLGIAMIAITLIETLVKTLSFSYVIARGNQLEKHEAPPPVQGGIALGMPVAAQPQQAAQMAQTGQAFIPTAYAVSAVAGTSTV